MKYPDKTDSAESGIEKPIFILGAGRSGTTVLYEFFSLHSDVCWFSNISDRMTHLGPMPVFHRLLDIPWIGNRIKKDILAKRRRRLRPSEGGRIYHDRCGFQHDRETTEADVDTVMGKKFKTIIRRHLRWTGKRRFLNKQTANNQRIRLLSHMFPDAFFIHIIRDGRAVASSLLHVEWWADTDIWWLGKKASEWSGSGREDIELCGLQWRHDVEAILNNKKLFADRYMEIRYERLVADVHGSMSAVLDFCELPVPRAYLNLLPATLPNRNDKWATTLSRTEQAALSLSIEPLLLRLGYGKSRPGVE